MIKLKDDGGIQMKKNLLKIGIGVVAIAIVVLLVNLTIGNTKKVKNPVATIVIEGYENPIKIEFDPKSAPNAVANFVKLANSGFYTDYEMTINDGKIVGTQSDDKMAKLSVIKENPQNDYNYGIKGDFLKNGVKNYIRHEKGVITMLRNDYTYFGLAEEGYNSANSAFALLTKDASDYNGYYAAFGKVVEGMDVLDQIAESRVDESANTEETTKSEDDTNKNKIVIKSITVDTFGVDYGMPEYVNYDENYQKVEQMYSKYFGRSSTN
jgi:peptidyl-prolyl cis-trans isomerase B (cyclophilin B)